MRVHQIINSYSLQAGGAERVARLLHQELRKKGIDSRLFGLMKLSDNNNELQYALSGSSSTPYSVTAFIELYNYVSENVTKGDIVHAHLFPAGIYLALLKKFGVLRSFLVYTEHSTSNRRRGSYKGKILDTIAYSEYENIYAISYGVKKELVLWLSWVRQKVKVIYNGAILKYPKVIERKNTDKPVILSVGRLTKAKNYATALHAIALLDSYDFEYYIAGDGDEYESLKSLSKKLGVTTKVRFMGHVDNVECVLEKADIFLIPSLWEGFGLAAVEAMNASLPIVASDINGLREVVAHKPSCALLVDPTSPESIADALKCLIVSYSRRNEMGKNAFQHSKKYSCDMMIDSYIIEYNKILKKEH